MLLLDYVAEFSKEKAEIFKLNSKGFFLPRVVDEVSGIHVGMDFSWLKADFAIMDDSTIWKISFTDFTISMEVVIIDITKIVAL